MGIRTPLGLLNGFLARSNDLKKNVYYIIALNLLHYRVVLHYWLILLHYRGVLHYREFITLLEQNIIIDIFRDISLVFYGGHFENRYPNPTGHIKWILARLNHMKKKRFSHYRLNFITLSGSITLSGVYYIIGAK